MLKVPSYQSHYHLNPLHLMEQAPQVTLSLPHKSSASNKVENTSRSSSNINFGVKIVISLLDEYECEWNDQLMNDEQNIQLYLTTAKNLHQSTLNITSSI